MLRGKDQTGKDQPGAWAIHADAEPTLRAMGERGDIVRTMQRAIGSQQRELAVFEPGAGTRPVVGRVAAKGLANELYDRGYLVVDGIDGKAHYVALPAKAELAQYPVGAAVEARGSGEVRAADRTIATLAVYGLYRTDHHLVVARAQANSDRDPGELVDAHVRRLEHCTVRASSSAWPTVFGKFRRICPSRASGMTCSAWAAWRWSFARTCPSSGSPGWSALRGWTSNSLAAGRALATWASAAKCGRRCGSARIFLPARGWPSDAGSG